jgi:hypothetical protein
VNEKEKNLIIEMTSLIIEREKNEDLKREIVASFINTTACI